MLMRQYFRDGLKRQIGQTKKDRGSTLITAEAAFLVHMSGPTAPKGVVGFYVLCKTKPHDPSMELMQVPVILFKFSFHHTPKVQHLGLLYFVISNFV